MRAAARPSQPAAPSTVVVSNTGVTITWTPPFNGGSPITAYSVKIISSDGLTYYNDLVNCNGSNAAIVATASCTVPISILQAVPFNLLWGASIYAKVIANNSVNDSD